MNDAPTDIHSICKTLQRYQQQAKQRMVELVDMETREKEMHAAMIIQVDSITTYKPVLHPNMIRFNEELLKEHRQEVSHA